jgi:hypothetical protein
MYVTDCAQTGWIHWYNLKRNIWAMSLAAIDKERGSMEDDYGDLLDDNGPLAPTHDIKPALNHGDPGTRNLGCPEDPVIPLKRKDGKLIQ